MQTPQGDAVIRCIVISPNATLRQTLIQCLQATPGVEVLRTLDHHPASSEAGRLIDSLQPQAVIIDTHEPLDARETARRLEALAPDLPLIGADWTVTSASLLKAMQAGLQDFVSSPFTPARLAEALERACHCRAVQDATPDPGTRMYSFIPAKPGAGASTIAMNTAIALAARNDGKALLMDLDFDSGIIGYCLNLQPACTVPPPAWEGSAESLFRSRVMRHGELDVVPAPFHSPSPSPARYTRQMVRMALNEYKSSVLDFAGELNEDMFDALRRAHIVFLVTTPEMPSLKLAHERIAQLTNEGLGDRLGLIVNRAGPIPSGQIEDLLGRSVYYEFPNNYQAVNAALQNGVCVDAMAERFQRFAGTISGDPLVREELPERTWVGMLGGFKRALRRTAL
jgi:pilus assembly protein CpaE